MVFYLLCYNFSFLQVLERMGIELSWLVARCWHGSFTIRVADLFCVSRFVVRKWYWFEVLPYLLPFVLIVTCYTYIDI